MDFIQDRQTVLGRVPHELLRVCSQLLDVEGLGQVRPDKRVIVYRGRPVLPESGDTLVDTRVVWQEAIYRVTVESKELLPFSKCPGHPQISRIKVSLELLEHLVAVLLFLVDRC